MYVPKIRLIFQTKCIFDWIFVSLHDFFNPNLLVCCIFEMYRKIRVFSEMLMSGIRGILLGLECLNTILALVFILYGLNAWKFHLDCNKKSVRMRRFLTKSNNKKT